MLVLGYAGAKRDAEELVGDLDPFLAEARAVLSKHNASQADDSRKPPYVHMPASRYAN